MNPGDCFFALRGPSNDGHDYVANVLERALRWRLSSSPSDAKILQLIVPDTLAALQQLARKARERWGGTVVGVTGSAGKTTTKDAIASLLNVQLRTGRTIGNYNNHYGVPLSILRLPDDCRAAVIEMGMNHAGEIRELAADRQAADRRRDQCRLGARREFSRDRYRRRRAGQARTDRGACRRRDRGSECR